jgi:hypothetical protein
MTTENNIESPLEMQYREWGYVDHYDVIDAESASSWLCKVCRVPRRYIGLRRGDFYIAIAHCDKCGDEFEF